MLLSLIPLFDNDLAVKAYSIFAQKDNLFSEPLTQSVRHFDGATNVPALELLEKMGIDTLSDDKEVFVPVTNVSIFADMNERVKAPHDRIVFLIDGSIPPVKMYVDRLVQLKNDGFRLAIRKITVAEFMEYAPILSIIDYVFLNNKKIVIDKAKVFFASLYPNATLVAGNIDTLETFENLKETGGYGLYEGDFYRVPVTKGNNELAPMKVTYLELLKIVNNPDFELNDAADAISRDTALTISLLKMVNVVVKTAQISSIRHAAAMLGQRELKKWINTAVVNEMYADSNPELTRLSLLRARFLENLSETFGLKAQKDELFLMGLLSVLDVVLEKPMSEALDTIQVSPNIKKALVGSEGPYSKVFRFMLDYENADWSAVSRQIVVDDLDTDKVAAAYMESLEWFRITSLGMD